MTVSPNEKILVTGGTLPGSVSSFGDLFVRAVTGRVPTGGILLRRTEDGVVDTELNNLLQIVRQVEFCPDGKKLAIACGSWTNPGQIIIVETSSGSILNRLSGHSGWVFKLSFSPDGNRLISWGSKAPRYVEIAGSETWIWNLADQDGRKLWESDTHPGCCVKFSPDGRHFAAPSGDRGALTLWDAETVRPKLEIGVENPRAGGELVFSPDGKTLVSSEDGWGYTPPHRYDAKLVFWNVSTGLAKKTVNVTDWWPERRTIRFGEMAFSNGGKYLAVPLGSWNRGAKWAQVSLYNAETSEQFVVYSADDQKPATSTCFIDGGQILVAAFANGEIRRWRRHSD